jgi:glutathione S-transferase
MLNLLPSLVVALTVVLLIFTTFKVGLYRGRHGIKAPAISGHPEFERAFRVQMNTLEASVMFLPSLWLATQYGGSPLVAGILGLVWLLARFWYALAYQGDASKRGLPFTLGLMTMAGLLGWGMVGLLQHMWMAA